MYQLNEIPLFKNLENCQNILLAGAGGGFDIFSGIPIYLNLRKQGKNVILANFSFTLLEDTNAEKVVADCYKIRPENLNLSYSNYFPEKHLSKWLAENDLDTEIYAFKSTGVLPLRRAYEYLIEQHAIDAIILIDGGTDSMLFGDEETLGTPQEDAASIAAVFQTNVKKKFLVAVGFGIDHFHGVCHYHFLENVAEIARENGYLGLFQLTKEMAGAAEYESLIQFANERQDAQSIVSNSILSALQGKYGDYHATKRTQGGSLWINPLMTIYWCFDLEAVVKKIKYYECIKHTNTLGELNTALTDFRRNLKGIRQKRRLPI